MLDVRRLSGFNYRLIMLSWLITLFDGLDMSMTSYTAPYMPDGLALSTMMLGNVFSAGAAGMVVGGLLLASLGDRIGRRPTVLIAAVAFGMLTLATGFARTYPQLLVLRFLDGFATGGMLPLAWALNIEFVPQRLRATVVTIIMMGYSAGGICAGPLTNLIAPQFGWQGVYWAGGGATLACAALLWTALPESIRFLVAHRRDPQCIARLLRRIDPAFPIRPGDRFVLADEPRGAVRARLADLFRGDLALLTPLLWLGYGASSMAIFFASSWGPLVLEALKVERHTAALVASLNGLLGAGAGLLLMRFTDRFGPRAITVYPLLAVPVLLFLGLGFVPPDLFLPLVVLGALLVGGEHAGVISIAAIFYPSAVRGTGAGWASSVGKLGGSMGPIVGAYVLSGGIPVQRSYALLAVCPAVLGLSLIGIAALLRRHGRQCGSAAMPVAGGVAGGVAG